MEQRSKRRRLSQQEEPLLGYFESHHGPWPQLHHGTDVGEGSHLRQEHLREVKPRPLRISSDFGLPLNKSRRAGHATTHGDRTLPKLVRRGLGDDRSPEPPLKTAIASMVQIVVDKPEKPLTKFLVPPGSSVIPLEGFGTLTLDTGPSPSVFSSFHTNSAAISSSEFSPSSLAYPAKSSTHRANPFVHSASSSQSAEPSQAERTSIPEASKTANEPTYSITIAKTSPSSSPSLKINLPGPDSQVVLISPPPTPIPSNPPSSVLSDSIESSSLTLPPISSSSSSRGTQSPPLSTTSRPIEPGILKASATGDPSSSVSPSISGVTSTDKSTLLSRTSNTAVNPTSTFTHSSATKRPRTLATSISNIRSRSHSSFKTSRIKSSTSSPITSTSTLQPSTSSSLVPTTSGVILGGAGGGEGGSGEPAGTINPSPPSGTSQSGGGSSGSSTRVAPPAVIGGVVGGVAGLIFFCLVAILLLRRRRNRQKRNLSSQPQGTSLPPGSAGHDVTTTERSSTAPLAAAAFFKRLRPQSGQTAATTDTTPSERGFQNLGGRKLESVLSSRGDGYSDPDFSPGMAVASSPVAGPSGGPRRPRGFGHSPGPSEPDTISRSSLYRDSQGFHGRNDGDPPSSSNLRPGSNTTSSIPGYPIPPESGLPAESIAGFGSGDDEIAVMRPSPARTPVTGGFMPPPPRSPRPIPSPRSPGTPISRGHRDGLGRSHPSFDGSRGSRFTEDM